MNPIPEGGSQMRTQGSLLHGLRYYVQSSSAFGWHAIQSRLVKSLPMLLPPVNYPVQGKPQALTASGKSGEDDSRIGHHVKCLVPFMHNTINYHYYTHQ
jgi:hypothetical protein